MEIIEYSKNWENIHAMPPEELSQLNLETLDEEDLDALIYRLKELGDNKKILTVQELMLSSRKENPAVEYMNIFEKVIIHYMAKKDYIKAADLLNHYLVYDEKERKGYRNHFIRRNLGMCYIFSGNVKKGEEMINELIHQFPKDFWTYHDIALEYYFAGDMVNVLKYLNMGFQTAKSGGDDYWMSVFKERIEELEE